MLLALLLLVFDGAGFVAALLCAGTFAVVGVVSTVAPGRGVAPVGAIAASS